MVETTDTTDDDLETSSPVAADDNVAFVAFDVAVDDERDRCRAEKTGGGAIVVIRERDKVDANAAADELLVLTVRPDDDGKDNDDCANATDGDDIIMTALFGEMVLGDTGGRLRSFGS